MNWKTIGFWLLALGIAYILPAMSGCVGNKAEVNALKIEPARKSTAAENIHEASELINQIFKTN